MDHLADLLVSKLHKYLDPNVFLTNLADDGWIFGGILLLEVLILGWSRSSIARMFARDGGSARVDLFNWLFTYAGLNLFLGLLLTMGVASLLMRFCQHVGLDWTAIDGKYPWSVPVRGVLAVVAGDCLYYWYHRLLHLRTLWPIHRFHHSAEEFCTLTSLRDHPVEDTLGNLTVAIPIALLGAPVGYVVLIPTVKRAITALHHSKFEGGWGWIGRWLFVPPRMHLIHHSMDPKHHNSNFGSMLTIWDRLFGTWVHDDTSTIRIGLEDAGRGARSWWRGVYESYRLFVGQLASDLRFRRRRSGA